MNPKSIVICSDPWRNGSASDSRSEGCVFDSRRVQNPDYVLSRAPFWAHLLFRTIPSEFLLVSFCWLCLFLRNDCRVHRVEINSLFELLLVWKELLVLESIFLQDQVVFTCLVVFTQSLFYIQRPKWSVKK